MAQFRQIIMPSGNHSDRLRASTLIKGEKKNERSGRAKSRVTEG